MDISIREGTPEDAEICGRICYNAFKTISEAHGFAPDFPGPETAIGVLTRMLANPKFYSVVAEVDGRIVGSNLINPVGLNGQLFIAVDRSGTSTNNNVYMLASLQPTGFSSGADVMFVRSTDGGLTFSAPSMRPSHP